MKKPILFLLLTAVSFSVGGCARTSRDAGTGAGSAEHDLVAKNLDFAAGQLRYALSRLDLITMGRDTTLSGEAYAKGDRKAFLPRSLRADGSLLVVPGGDWTSGFFPGELWMMYEYTQDPLWIQAARRYTDPIECQKLNTGTHDLGFMLYCSFGNGFRLTGDPHYREVLIQTARTLVGRFNPTVGCIRSWDFGTWKYPVIIDNMLNLELLMWAYEQTGESQFRDVAVSHANTTLKNHFRADNSTYHVVDYDPQTGAVIGRGTHQGYSDDSAWARGQSWGLYGYTMMFRKTGIAEYLEQARKIAAYMFENPSMPEDLVPYWDYSLPECAGEPRDASSAAIAASALYELDGYVPDAGYKQVADTILEHLSRDYTARPGTSEGFLLLHSTGHKPVDSEVDVPINYADYYFLEALLRKWKLEAGQPLFLD